MVARARITVRLTDEEWEALVTGAQVERRDPRDQAGLFVREGLQRAGYLPPIDGRATFDNGGGLEPAHYPNSPEVTR